VIGQLREQFGERVSTNPTVLEAHGHDESYHATLAPDAVVLASSTKDVAAVLAFCHATRVPVVPYGAGTSLEGGVSAPYGGISLDLSGMNRILDVSAEDLDATVQAGVTQVQLNKVVQRDGMFFSVDPGAEATLGGMCATRASGTTAVRYGTMRDNVLGLTAVTADGTVIRTGGHARKSAAGYDLTRLLIGSEGTLAVITEVIVRLHPVAESVVAATCAFPDLEAAVSSVVALLQSGVTPARVELLDDVMVDAVVRYGGLEMPVLPTVFYELQGPRPGQHTRRAGAAVEGPARRAAGSEGTAARLLHVVDRRLRAHLATGRVLARDQAGHRRIRTHRPHRGTRR
jgi:D-lactate dehydrogenase (cytochrome)